MAPAENRFHPEGAPRFAAAWWRVLGISAEERTKVVLLFAYFFLVICAFWVQKPIRTPKFLIAVGVQYLPFVKLGTAFLILPIMLIYSSLVRRYCRECMVVGCVMVFIVGSLVFWYFFSRTPPRLGALRLFFLC